MHEAPLLPMMDARKLVPAADCIWNSMNSLKAKPSVSTEGRAPYTVRGKHLGVIAVTLGFAGLLCLWHSFDHLLPLPDDASYLLGSFKYADLLSHPKFWRADWWYSMLTVNRVYPPTVMVFNGVLKMLFGPAFWVNVLSVALINMILTATVYGTTFLLSGKRRAAILAAVLVNLYPETAYMSHGFALDQPLLSMISFGLFALVWWRSAPSWPRSIACGIILGLVCLTKQIAAAYLIVPGVFFFIESVMTDASSRRVNRSLQLIATAAVAALIGLPWLVTNIPYIRFLAQDNEANMGKLPLSVVLPQNIAWYARSLPSVMSPVLFASFVMSVFVIGKEAHKKLLPVALSAVGGVFLICVLTWVFPSLRYVAPALVATSIYTGWALSRLLDGKLQSLVVVVLLSLSSLQFISFNFSPYPISAKSVTQISEQLGVELVEIFGLTERDKRVMRVKHTIPNNQNWEQRWVISTIDRAESRKAVWLNIVPDFVQLNGNTFEFLAKLMGSPVRPTTCRRWTVMGDRVTFDPETATYCQWYLLKTGKQGNLLRDDESARNYAKLIDFVQHSGRYLFVDSRPLPDGSTMSLYRQTSIVQTGRAKDKYD